MMWQYIAVLVLAGALHISHAAIGDECVTALDCSVEESICHFGFSTCETGTCQCPDGYYFYAAENICNQQKGHGEPCSINEDCADLTVGATCQANVCACPAELTDITDYDELNYCHLAACTDDAQCLANIVHPAEQNRATCVTSGEPPSGACECSEQFTQDENAIVCLASQVGEDCDSTKICEPETDLTCDTTCNCPDGKTWSDVFGDCIFEGTSAGVGESCIEDGSETAVYCEDTLTCAVCENNNANFECQAGRGAVGIGEPCVLEETSQVCATGNAVCTAQYDGCTSGRCYCAENFYLKDGECMQSLKCLEEDDCDGALNGEVTCQTPEDPAGGTCTCSDVEGIVEETIGGIGYCGREIGAACVAADNPAECIAEHVTTGSSVCTEGNCACAAGYMPEGNVCVRLTLDGACNGNDEWCRSNLECTDDACACPADHTWSEDYQMCIHNQAATDVEVNQQCNEDAGDPQNLEYCSYWLECDVCPEEGPMAQDMCKSVPGREAPGLDLGVDCPFDSEESADQCITENSECAVAYDGCTRGVCSCSEGYYEDENGICREDGTCATDADCAITFPGSTCNTLRNCVCGEGRVTEEHNGVTYCGVPAGESCQPADNPVPDGCLSEMIRPSSTECTGVRGSNCACLSGFQTVDNTCVPYSHGDSCEGGIGGNERVCAPELGLSCQDDGDGGRTCQCADTHEWRDAYGMCIHTSATLDREEGQSCNEDPINPNSLEYCEPELVCEACPGEEGAVCHVAPEVPGEDPNTTQPPPDDGTTADPDDGTEPNDPDDGTTADPDDPNEDPDGGAVHMHVSTALMVLAGILACYHIY